MCRLHTGTNCPCRVHSTADQLAEETAWRSQLTEPNLQPSPARYNAPYVWSISLVAALGGLMFGYDWIVISGAKPFYERFFRLSTPSATAWAMSSALVGCLIGAMVAGG